MSKCIVKKVYQLVAIVFDGEEDLFVQKDFWESKDAHEYGRTLENNYDSVRWMVRTIYKQEVKKMARIKLFRIEQGVCPFCGNMNLEYDFAEFEDDMLYYPATCNVCGQHIEEWYNLTFAGHNVGKNCAIATEAGAEDIELDTESDL